MSVFVIYTTVIEKWPLVITLKEVLSVVATMVMKEMVLKAPAKVNYNFNLCIS